MKKTTLIFICFTAVVSYADKASIKVDNVGTEKETSIVIKKGTPTSSCLCNKFQLIDGSDELSGESEFEASKAKASWRAACQEWKNSIRELNKENRLISLSCGRAEEKKDGTKTAYLSKASYKVRVKMEEKLSED